MIVSALYVLVAFAAYDDGPARPKSPVEIGRYSRDVCFDQANLGNHIGERGIVYRCIPAGPFQTLDRPTR